MTITKDLLLVLSAIMGSAAVSSSTALLDVLVVVKRNEEANIIAARNEVNLYGNFLNRLKVMDLPALILKQILFSLVVFIFTIWMLDLLNADSN